MGASSSEVGLLHQLSQHPDILKSMVGRFCAGILGIEVDGQVSGFRLYVGR